MNINRLFEKITDMANRFIESHTVSILIALALAGFWAFYMGFTV